MMSLIALALLTITGLLQPAPATQPDIAEQCHQLLESWRDRFAQERFTAVLSPPFVIAGDGGMGKIEQYRDGTILAAQQALNATYFHKQPTRPILILLFESESSYRRLAKSWFDENDVPHFGFYRRDNVMLMNVSTGTGTLVHELVHALMKSDFPEAPAWFNEGLASLYEQCTISGESIRGLANWRLPMLKRAIAKNQLRPLREMIEDEHFYRDDLAALNYAQARYLMLYLQERGQLKSFYAQFRDNCQVDPTGMKTLQQFIQPQSLEEFDQTWRRWVLSLLES